MERERDPNWQKQPTDGRMNIYWWHRATRFFGRTFVTTDTIYIEHDKFNISINYNGYSCRMCAFRESWLHIVFVLCTMHSIICFSNTIIIMQYEPRSLCSHERLHKTKWFPDCHPITWQRRPRRWQWQQIVITIATTNYLQNRIVNSTRN